IQGVGLWAMASVSPQNRLRHAMISPSSASLPRNSSEPAARSALAMIPTRKSSFTANRVQPSQFLHVTVQQDVFPRDQHVVENEDGVILVEARGQRIVVLPTKFAIISYEARQSNFTPGAFIGAMNMMARSVSCVGTAPAPCPRKL